MDSRQVIDLLSQAHTCVWAQGRLVALLSWVLALSGPTDWSGDGGGLSTALSLGLRSGGLESKFGQGLGSHDRRVVSGCG